MPVTRRAARCCSLGRGSVGGAGLLLGLVPGSKPNLVAGSKPNLVAGLLPLPGEGLAEAGMAVGMAVGGSDRRICIGSERRRWSVAIRSALGGGIVGGVPPLPPLPPLPRLLPCLETVDAAVRGSGIGAAAGEGRRGGRRGS